MDTLFWNLAIFGTAAFIIRTILNFIGLGGDDHADVYHDVDSASGTEVSFKVISLTTVLAFIAAFGWCGLAATTEFGLSQAAATGIAFVIGIIVMIAVAYLFKSIVGLETHGIAYRIEDSVGKTATVYERIPSDGTGVIQVSFAGMLREIKARSADGADIASGQTVIVASVLNDSTVSVKGQSKAQ